MSDTASAIALREAGAADCRRVWEWRNERSARAASFNEREVPYDEHERWFHRRLADGRMRIFIANDGERDVGYVRFDGGADVAEISVCVDASCRRRGLGRAMIRTASDRMLEGGARRIRALIRTDNPTSLAAFERAGFRQDAIVAVHSSLAWRLWYGQPGVVPRGVGIAFRVDADGRVGLGHLQRCLSLASALAEHGARCRFLVNGSIAANRVVRAGFPCETLSGESWTPADVRHLIECARRSSAQVVVVDSDDDGAEYLGALRQAGCCVCAIDDVAAAPYPNQIVLNGDAHAPSLGYRSASGDTAFLLGREYAILGTEYWTAATAPPARPRVERLLVTLGGGDAHALMPTLVRALSRLPDRIGITVSIGPFNRSLARIRAATEELNRPVELAVAPSSLYPLIASCDFAITAAGQTLYELACLGRPAVAIRVADNQREQEQAFAQWGTIQLAGDARDAETATRAVALAGDLINRPDVLRAMGEAGRSFVDGNGARRAAEAVLRLSSQPVIQVEE